MPPHSGFSLSEMLKFVVLKYAVTCGSHHPDIASLEDDEQHVLRDLQAESGGPLITDIVGGPQALDEVFTRGQLRSLSRQTVCDCLHDPTQPGRKSLCVTPQVCTR